MKIYIDFDDVICETAKYFTKIAKELFGIDVPYRQVQFFNLQKSFDLSDDQYDKLMEAGHLQGMRFLLLQEDLLIRMSHPENGWTNIIWRECLCFVSINMAVKYSSMNMNII
ncbi:hypothetical protein [uncultured Methanobrevibacter sp.]|uniref:hypothetical protein n=1 Tax=uncultured Methanobrevibacter sp. TaxID=253161 RepID=UPI0025D4C0FB|nr:hypothetical protein [uncultured Methanobrevibacter sp.]